MNINEKMLLYQIMKVEFAVIETSMYLNTHPDDMRALTHHNLLAQQLAMLKNQYETLFGPLTPQSPSQGCWRFVKSPWPWDIDMSHECEVAK